MEKPIIFFSHSSKDKRYLLSLKNKIIKLTSNSIEIFQSSDGESIPFGNNWVHKIEQNLNDCKLMFVFISPYSIKSNWIFFETGFSYSKGIRVIPVGINGINVGELTPPMNLLQGFNISSHEGINNIVSVINKEFSTSYDTNFMKEDFESLKRLSSNNQVSTSFSKIDFFETTITNNGRGVKAYKLTIEYLKNKNIKYGSANIHHILLDGMSMNFIESMLGDMRVVCKLDTMKLEKNLKIVNDLFPILNENKTTWYSLRTYFDSDFKMISKSFKLSSRLSDIEIDICEGQQNLYVFKNLIFGIISSDSDETHLKIILKPGELKLKEVFELIEILLEQRIIYKT